MKLAAANLAHQLGLAAHVAAVQVEAVAVRVLAGDGLAVQLAQQDISKGFRDRGGSAFEQVGNAHMEQPVFQADGTIGVDELAELHP